MLVEMVLELVNTVDNVLIVVETVAAIHGLKAVSRAYKSKNG